MGGTDSGWRCAASLMLAAMVGLRPATPAAQLPAHTLPAQTAVSRPASPALVLQPPRPVRPGDVIVLDAHAAPEVDAVTATAFGRDIQFYSEQGDGHWLAVVGVDLDVRPGIHAISLTGSRGGSAVATAHSGLTVQPKQFATRRLRVASRFVEPPAAEALRIVREAERLAAVFAQVTPRHWSGGFRTPLSVRPNSNFGTRSVFNGQPRNPHAGVDFAAPAGTPVAAPNGGIVALAESLYFTGNTVILDHGLGLYSLYAHLSRLDVVPGRSVAAGDIVGLLGATGRVTGPHLHWAIRLNGARVDPLSLVAALPMTSRPAAAVAGPSRALPVQPAPATPGPPDATGGGREGTRPPPRL